MIQGLQSMAQKWKVPNCGVSSCQALLAVSGGMLGFPVDQCRTALAAGCSCGGSVVEGERRPGVVPEVRFQAEVIWILAQNYDLDSHIKGLASCQGRIDTEKKELRRP